MTHEADELFCEQMCAVVHALIGYRREARRGSVMQIQGSVVAAAPARTCVVPKFFIPRVVTVVRIESTRFWGVLLHMETQVPLHGFQQHAIRCECVVGTHVAGSGTGHF